MEAGYFLGCRLERVKLSTLMPSYPWLKQCTAAEGELHKNKTKVKIRKNACLTHLINQCYTADIRVFKTIRLPMGLIHTLLDMSPSLKVIYNTRDPRGIYASRKLIEHFKPNQTSEKVRDMCRHIVHDLQVYSGNKDIYKRHFLRTSYDELVTNSIGLVDRVYKWLGFKLDQSLLEDIVYRSLTSGGRRLIQNPTSRWKTHLTKEEISLINTQCRLALNQWGYWEEGGL